MRAERRRHRLGLKALGDRKCLPRVNLTLTSIALRVRACVSFHAAAHNLIDLPSATVGDDVDDDTVDVHLVDDAVLADADAARVRGASERLGRLRERVLSFLKTLSAARSLVAMIARVTMRTELGASRALPTARHARVELGIRFKPVVSRCLVAMIARVTMRPELGPSRALLTALHPL